MDKRSITRDAYRYGFQNQEKDDEIKGAGNSLNYKYRMHDPRLGRFFAVDPLATNYSYNSPYNFSENRVLDGVELEGKEVFVINGTLGPKALERGRAAVNNNKKDPGGYSPQILSTNLNSEDKTIAEIFGNTKVFDHVWAGYNNSQARMSEADCVLEQVTANHIVGEAITIVGHSHGGSVAILAAEKVYNYYKAQGIEVEINLLTLNAPYVIGSDYKLSDEASNSINWIEVYNPFDKVVPHAGSSETGILNEGGETTDGLGRPTGEYASTDKAKANNVGSTRLQHPQADNSITYKDQYSFLKRHGADGGGKTWLVGHRGWLTENVKDWIGKLEKVVNKKDSTIKK